MGEKFFMKSVVNIVNIVNTFSIFYFILLLL